MGPEWVLNQLDLRPSATLRAEIFTGDVSSQENSSLKISAQMDDSKWEINSEGGGP